MLELQSLCHWLHKASHNEAVQCRPCNGFLQQRQSFYELSLWSSAQVLHLSSASQLLKNLSETADYCLLPWMLNPGMLIGQRAWSHDLSHDLEQTTLWIRNWRRDLMTGQDQMILPNLIHSQGMIQMWV